MSEKEEVERNINSSMVDFLAAFPIKPSRWYLTVSLKMFSGSRKSKKNLLFLQYSRIRLLMERN